MCTGSGIHSRMHPAMALFELLTLTQGKAMLESPASATAAKSMTSFEQFQAVFGYNPSDLLAAAGRPPSLGSNGTRTGSPGAQPPGSFPLPGQRTRSVSPMSRSAHAGAPGMMGGTASLAYIPKKRDEQQLNPSQQRTIMFRAAVTKSTSERADRAWGVVPAHCTGTCASHDSTWCTHACVELHECGRTSNLGGTY